MIKITELSHKLIKEIKLANLAVDMTAGRGSDTLFLAGKFEKVIAFDIQDEAISETKSLLESHDIKNVTLIKDSHSNINDYLNENVDCAIYNLGYLPNGNKRLKTEVSTTIASLEAVIKLLNLNGLIVIVLYPHNSEEIDAVLDLTSKLSTDFDCMEYRVINRSNSPFIITINKVK